MPAGSKDRMLHLKLIVLMADQAESVCLADNSVLGPSKDSHVICLLDTAAKNASVASAACPFG